MSEPIHDLLRSHDGLRALLRFAMQEIEKLQFGNKETDRLRLLRTALKEEKSVADKVRSELTSVSESKGESE